jgi:hypothetical protein
MNRLLRLGFASTLALSACHPHLAGNGVLGEEVRVVAPFDAVDITLGIQATVTANATTQKVTISGDENLLAYVLTPVEAGVLKTRLHGTSGIEPVLPLRITAQATALQAVHASQAANVDVKGAGDPAPGFVFEVEASEASHVQLQGIGGQQLQVNLSGASGLDAWAYPVAEATVQVSGGSLLRLHSASDPVGSVSGASSVQITGGGRCAALTVGAGSSCSPP